MTNSARCDGQKSNQRMGVTWFTTGATSTVIACDEDIVSDLLSMAFSRLTFNKKKLELTKTH